MTADHMFFQAGSEGESGEHVERRTVELPAEAPQARTYSAQEKALRDLFVQEYLVDYNALHAAMRCGFQHQFAVQYGKAFLEEPYVQQRISQLGLSAEVDEEELEEYNRRRVRESLTREAFYYGPGSSHAARVAALTRLAEMQGQLSKGKAAGAGGGAGGVAGGVMQVPQIASADAWEAVAVDSQTTLTQDAAEDRH